MRKIQTTKKSVLNASNTVIECGYCALATTLNAAGIEPKAYTASRIYGWGADVYELPYNVVLVSGYRPFGTVTLDREKAEEIEQATLKVLHAKDEQEAGVVAREMLERLAYKAAAGVLD